MAGQSGIGPITRFDASTLKTQIAGEVKNFDPSAVISGKEIRTMDLFIQYALVASHEALNQSGLVKGREAVEESLQRRAGTIIGCGLGGLPEIESTMRLAFERGPSRISPFFIPRIISNLAAGQVAMVYGLRHANYCATSACSSGAHAVGEAFRLIKHGYADVMVSGGTEATIAMLGIGGFDAMKALSSRNHEPTRASRPFDKGRDGFVCGEGAGILVLEEWERAKKRGANILAEVVGYGATCDAYHLTAPSEGGRGAGEAMENGLEEAQMRPDQIQAVNAHGTSTPLGDIAETQAIKRIFGDHARKLKVTSTKSMTGHCLGAAGGIEAVYSVLSLVHQIVPPTINLEEPDPECDLDYVPLKAQEHSVDGIVSNSFGFGGTNVSLVFRRPQ
jgi:3-oxoacyl-[acyl-carrier-protein] synthase II